MTTRSILVAASADDCRVFYDSAAWQLRTTHSLYVGYTSNVVLKQGCGMRFLGANIPKNSIINTSYITLTAEVDASENIVKSRFTGEKANGVPAVYSTIADYQARRGVVVGGANDDYITTAQVDFDSIAAWTLDTAYNSPSLNTILTELVAISALKDIGIFWDDHDGRGDAVGNHVRRAYPYDTSTIKCPLLYVNFTPYYKVFPSIKLLQPASIK